MRQVQTDTGPEIRLCYVIIYLIETFENTLYFIPVNADTAIRYHNLKIFT